MTWCASAVDSCLACSALGTASVTPDFIRFMLSSMNAVELLRYSETSIWSSDTPGLLCALAMDVSVSPGRTLTLSAPADSSVGAGAGAGRGAFATGAGAGVGAGLGARTAGAGAAAGGSEVAACGAG